MNKHDLSFQIISYQLLWIQSSHTARFKETAISGNEPRKQPNTPLPKRCMKQSRGCWEMECPAPCLNGCLMWGTHPRPNCLFVISSKWDREGVVKSTDMLALGGPPFKNSSFFAAVDTFSCRFPSSLDPLADEFRNYTGLPSCCYWVEQALFRPSSWPYYCPECYRRKEDGRTNHQRFASHLQELWVKLGRWNTHREITQ